MPWVTPVVFKQASDEPLTRVPCFDDGPRKIRFRHLIHVYGGAASAVRAITFETIEMARRFSAPDHDVDVVVVSFPEDVHLVPPAAIAAEPLTRDVSNIQQFRVLRRLPLLFDIIRLGISAPLKANQHAAARAPDARPREFVVLSNVDIHFQPFVYRALAALIGQGYDVITTNRRTIDASAEPEHFWPLMMAERGSDHPGFDCFVFPVSLFERFAPSYCCCGASHAMRSLLFNLVAHATRFLMLTTAQLSFHVGDDRYWSDPAFEDYTSFNYDQAKQAILSLSKEPSVAARLYDFIVAQEGWPYNELLPALASRADQ